MNWILAAAQAIMGDAMPDSILVLAGLVILVLAGLLIIAMLWGDKVRLGKWFAWERRKPPVERSRRNTQEEERGHA